MNDATREEAIASIQPKSDQLNADDLLTGPITVTITKVSRGDREQPIVVEIEGHRPYKPCKSMRRVLIAAFGDDPAHWIGQKMTLYCDPEVMFGGIKVGGIRISHLSGLQGARTFVLTQARGKRAQVVVQPLAAMSPEDESFVREAQAEIATAETLEVLKSMGFILKTKSKPVQDALRQPYARRLGEFKAAAED